MKKLIAIAALALTCQVAQANYIIYYESKSYPGQFPTTKAQQYMSETVVGVAFKRWDKASQQYLYYPQNPATGLPYLYKLRTFHPWSTSYKFSEDGSEIMTVQDYVMQHYTCTIHTIDPFGFEHVTRYDSIYNCGDAWIYYSPGVFSGPSVLDHIYGVPQPSAGGTVRSVTISTGDPVRNPAKP